VRLQIGEEVLVEVARERKVASGRDRESSYATDGASHPLRRAGQGGGAGGNEFAARKLQTALDF
jgi:hypothetical protein